MKKTIQIIIGLMCAGSVYTGCTDQVLFGNDFINKAPGGSSNLDSIFANPDYVNQYLTNLYNKQYYLSLIHI